MRSSAVVLHGPGHLSVAPVTLSPPSAQDLVVEIRHSGVSTGTEKLFWSGEMPPFPGMGYPLVPGYEAVGKVVEAGADTRYKVGDAVFVPGATCYEDAHGLFGGSSRLIVTDANRATPIDSGCQREMTLLALAATARHSMAGLGHQVPELIVGHGVVGRLLARLTIAAGAPAPLVWETNPARRDGAQGYQVVAPEDDPRRDYGCIYDASGDSAILNTLVSRLKRTGEIVLTGFYSQPLSFAFPPAFMKEARMRIAAEWTPEDMRATRSLVESGALSLADLISHIAPAMDAPTAYGTAFEDPDCLKLVLDWEIT
ncbi:MAG: chlorophyll synthesis pathway protein BchC [Pseudomonadota bacterium]